MTPICRDAIADPTAGPRARDIGAFPARVRPRVDPTDPRYRHPRVEGGQASPNPDPTDPTYGPGAKARRPDRPGGRRRRHAAHPGEDPTEPHPGAHPGSSDRVDIRVLVRRTGRGVGTSLPLVVAARPMGHVHGLALGEGSTEHLRVAGSPVGQVFGRRRDERLSGPAAGRVYVLRLRGVRSA